MQSYSWPGNVRELQNICERAAVLCPDQTIERSLVEPWLASSAAGSVAKEGLPTAPLAGVAGLIGGGFLAETKPNGFDRETTLGMLDGRPLEDIEREAIVRTLHRFQGHRQRTASALGIGVRTLGLKLKKWKEMKLVEENL
jgi:DNA-binding NtrC family response regulator